MSTELTTMRTYNRLFRWMHWGIALSMLGLLLTIFLRLGWMEKTHVAAIADAYLQEQGVVLEQDQLIVMAKKIRKPMWEWHIYFGYALTLLYAIRLALPFWGEMRLPSPFTKNFTTKQRFQFWVYWVFYVLVAISLTTGLLIEWGPKSWKAPMEALHKPSIYYLVTFVVLHLGGVWLADRGNERGLLSRILHGERKEK